MTLCGKDSPAAVLEAWVSQSAEAGAWAWMNQGEGEGSAAWAQTPEHGHLESIHPRHNALTFGIRFTSPTESQAPPPDSFPSIVSSKIVPGLWFHCAFLGPLKEPWCCRRASAFQSGEPPHDRIAIEPARNPAAAHGLRRVGSVFLQPYEPKFCV